jgi:hypothetical protein
VSGETDFERVAAALGEQGLILPFPGAAFGLGAASVGNAWEIRSAMGACHARLPSDLTMNDALALAREMAANSAPSAGAEPAGTDVDDTAPSGRTRSAPGWPSLLYEPLVGRVCWTHPVYDGRDETWRPRTRVVTKFSTIADFLEAKRAEGWEVEAFDELATAPDGHRYPVVAVSLTRRLRDGSIQDDLMHVWVEPVATPASEVRLEWRHAPVKDGQRERYTAAEGAYRATVWRQPSSGHWFVSITDVPRWKTVREWDAGDTRAQATSAAERTLSALRRQVGAAAP